ncbi:hypothetical protein VTN96DRAFT_3931 [Rasamsonia emersonii]
MSVRGSSSRLFRPTKFNRYLFRLRDDPLDNCEFSTFGLDMRGPCHAHSVFRYHLTANIINRESSPIR